MRLWRFFANKLISMDIIHTQVCLIKVGQETQNDNFSFSSKKYKKRKNYMEYFQPDTTLFIATCGIHLEKITHTTEKLIIRGRIHFIWD